MPLARPRIDVFGYLRIHALLAFLRRYKPLSQPYSHREVCGPALATLFHAAARYQSGLQFP